MMNKITPFLWFDDNAVEAMRFYKAIFKSTKVYGVHRQGGKVLWVHFRLNNQDIMGLNGGPQFKFTQAISFFVSCKTQKEVDRYWEKLSRGGKKGRCGWLTDKFGLSWQIVPETLGRLLGDPDKKKSDRVFQAMMKMTKLDIQGLKQAAAGLSASPSRRGSRTRTRR